MANTKRCRWNMFEEWPIEKIIGDCYVQWFQRFGPQEPNICILPVGIPAPEIFGPMRIVRDHQLQPHDIDIDLDAQSAPQGELQSAPQDTTVQS